MGILISKILGVVGLIVLVGIAFLLSDNKKKINWKLVGIGVAVQIAFALLILKFPPGRWFFEQLSNVITKILDFTREGTTFLFGSLMDADKFGVIFALQVLPTIIFFSSLMSVLYHLGIMQAVIRVVAKGIAKLLGTSGAETTSAVGNIFLGQTEAPLLIKPYIKNMTKSEVLTIMVGGMATVAGGVMAGYVAMGINAGNLLAASIMAAPAGLVVSKIICPETEEPATKGNTDVQLEVTSSNVIEAAANGASEGLGLALNVGAMLLAFIALIALINYVLGLAGGVFGFPQFSLNWILGRLFAPIAFIIGVPMQDVLTAGGLFGQKVAINEFIAYSELSKLIASGALQQKTIAVMTYALCGFANLSSIAIQIGGIGGLAPEKKPLIAKFGVKALIGGTLANLMTATIAGILF